MNILIVQTGFLGDIILSTPVIKGVKELYPDSDIYFLTTPAGRLLVENDPYIKKVLVYDKRGREKGIKGILKIKKKINKLNISKVFSLHKSFRTSLMLFLTGIPERTGFKKAKLSFLYHTKEKRNPDDHDAVRNLSILNSEADINLLPQDLRLFSPEDNEIKPELRSFKDIKYILMSPGSTWHTKMWNSKGYNETADYFEKKGYFIVITGSKVENEICSKVIKNTNSFNLCGDLNLSELKFMISNAKLVICNDNMALHMASALKRVLQFFVLLFPNSATVPGKIKILLLKKISDAGPVEDTGIKNAPLVLMNV